MSKIPFTTNYILFWGKKDRGFRFQLGLGLLIEFGKAVGLGSLSHDSFALMHLSW